MSSTENKTTAFKSIVIDNVKYKTLLTKKFLERKSFKPTNIKELFSVIPGTVLKLAVKEGSSVHKGDLLMVLEAMKMENQILAPISGTIKNIHISEGEVVPKSKLLLEFE